jgi:FkbM family methyltransferase
MRLIDLCDKYNLDLNGIVHVGAHQGQEIDEYLSMGAKKIILFEPTERNFSILKQKESENVKCFQYAIGEEEKQIEMFLASNEGQSSSVLEPKNHLQQAPSVVFEGKELVFMKKLSSFEKEIKNCDCLCIDVQGYEYQVLVGAEKLLNQFNYVFLEVNRGETYKNNHMIEDLDALLSEHFFERVETYFFDGCDWGDAFYIKSKKNLV